MLRLAEVRITAHRDLAKACLVAQGEGLVEIARSTFLRRSAGGAVEDEQRLLGVGQGYQQGVIAPDTFVGQVHPPLALSGSRYQSAVGFQDGVLEKGRGLLLPDQQAFTVDLL